MLRRERAIEIAPSSKPLRWRRYDVPQHLAPETSDALRFCAVEGDLDLPDRCHGSTLAARSYSISAAPPPARHVGWCSRRMRFVTRPNPTQRDGALRGEVQLTCWVGPGAATRFRWCGRLDAASTS